MTDDIVARLRQQARNRYADLADGELAARQTVEWAAADEIEALRAFRERDKGEIESLRETVETLMRGSRAGELIDEANALRDDLRQATTKLGAAEARGRELEAVNAALNERAAQYERLYRNAEAETIERCAKVADEHRAHVPNHDPEMQSDDLVAQGYGNAAFNIATAIRKLAQEVS